jgi:hypothetical protein
MGNVILFSLTAMFNPVLVGATTVMLLLPSPRKLMLGYLLGAWMTSLTLGLIIVFAASDSSAVSTTQNTIAPAVDLALGAILLIVSWALASGRHERRKEQRAAKKEPKEDKGPPRWQRELSKGDPKITFAVGALLTLPGGSYIAAMDNIVKMKVSSTDEVLLVIMVNLIMLLPLELPLISFTVAPDWTPTAVDRTKRWFARNGHTIAVYGTAILGALLVIRGIIELASA